MELDAEGRSQTVGGGGNPACRPSEWRRSEDPRAGGRVGCEYGKRPWGGQLPVQMLTLYDSAPSRQLTRSFLDGYPSSGVVERSLKSKDWRVRKRQVKARRCRDAGV